jgi:hypothetical protein
MLARAKAEASVPTRPATIPTLDVALRVELARDERALH